MIFFYFIMMKITLLIILFGNGLLSHLCYSGFMRPHVRQLYFEHALLNLAVTVGDTLGDCTRDHAIARNAALMELFTQLDPWQDL